MHQLPPLTDTDHILGDPKAPVVLVHYGDFECPYSGAAYPIIKQAVADFGDDLCLVFRPFPLPDVHPHAVQAALAAEAAGDKFWEMHDVLFENQDLLDMADLFDYAQLLGLDEKSFEKTLRATSTIEKIRHSVDSAKHIGVHGTPTFFINGEFHDNREGLWEAPHLMSLLEKARDSA
jgi:protein-disulfide isomerase